MSSYLTVKWCDSKPGEMKKPPAGATPAERLQMAVDGFECVQAARARKMPSVLFVFSEAKLKRNVGVRAAFNPEPDKPGKEELTSAAKSSLAVYQRVFDNVQDVPLRILLRFFQPTRLDVTLVPGGTHPDIAEPHAPLVLIVDAQGKVAQILSQTRIDSRALTLGMKDVLVKGGLRNIDSLCASTLKLMTEMEAALVAKGKIEVKMAELKASLAKYEAQDQKRPNKGKAPLPPSPSTVRAKSAVDQMQISLDAAERAVAALKEKDTAMLRNAGVDLEGGQQGRAPAGTSTGATTGTPTGQAAPVASSGGSTSPVMRTWTSVSGNTLVGQFSSLQQGTVVLTKSDGSIVQIPIDKLSPGDQAVARQLAASRTP